MKKILLTILCIVCCFSLAACGKDGGTGSKNDGKFKVVTSFYPVYIQTLNVTKGIDGVEVENMTANRSGDIHDYQMTPADMKKLESANVFVVNGAGMESFLDKVVKDQKDLTVIEASKGIDLIKDDHGINPHVWLNVDNVIIEVQNIADGLAKADPQHADQYKANAKAYIDKLQLLQHDIHQQIDPLPNRQIVTFHEAFPYFAREFNLSVVGVIEVEPGEAPSPKQVEEISAVVNKMKHKVIFTEPNFAPDAAKTIAQETGAKIYTLDPGESGSDSPDAYIDMMKKNTQVLVEALK